MKLLHLDSSILGDNSVSRQLGQQLKQAWLDANPSLQVHYRDVGSHVIPLLDSQLLGVNGISPEQRSPLQQAQAELNGQLLQELLEADVLLIGAPMYNFSIPAGLRSWFDRVLVAGTTFRYTATGPEGLLHGKRAVLVLTAGGIHAHTPVNAMYEGYLRTVLAFIGITEVEVVRAEGLNMGDAARAQGLQQAGQQIAALAPWIGAAREETAAV